MTAIRPEQCWKEQDEEALTSTTGLLFLILRGLYSHFNSVSLSLPNVNA